MYNPYKKQAEVLERFRIKAHLRSYVKEPIIIDEELLSVAVTELKKLPYEDRDPTDTVAKKLVLNALSQGYYKCVDLTELGCQLVRDEKYRGHQRINKNASDSYMLRAHLQLKAI